MSNLKDRFEEIIHLTWDEFIKIEKDKNASVDDVIICKLVRLCTDTDDIAAAKTAFDRIEGIQEVPVSVKVPKFYIRYVNAKAVEDSPKEIEAPQVDTPKKETKVDPATMKLRETLIEMRKMPKQVINLVLHNKKLIEEGKNPEHIPKVKSIIVANLLRNVKKGRLRAIELVFNQIDGKLTKTITLLGGEDVYVDDYNTLTAPAGSIKDEQGNYIAEDKTMTSNWIRGFAQSQKGLEILAEGLEDV